MPAPKDNASSGTVTCPKCKGRKVSAHWMDGFRNEIENWRRRAQAAHGWHAIHLPPAPRSIASCRPGHCPAGEHLHRECDRCGYAWTTPIAGGVLGPTVMDGGPPPPDDASDPGRELGAFRLPNGQQRPAGVLIVDPPRPWWRFW